MLRSGFCFAIYLILLHQSASFCSTALETGNEEQSSLQSDLAGLVFSRTSFNNGLDLSQTKPASQRGLSVHKNAYKGRAIGNPKTQRTKYRKLGKRAVVSPSFKSDKLRLYRRMRTTELPNLKRRANEEPSRKSEGDGRPHRQHDTPRQGGSPQISSPGTPENEEVSELLGWEKENRDYAGSLSHWQGNRKGSDEDPTRGSQESFYKFDTHKLSSSATDMVMGQNHKQAFGITDIFKGQTSHSTGHIQGATDTIKHYQQGSPFLSEQIQPKNSQQEEITSATRVRGGKKLGRQSGVDASKSELIEEMVGPADKKSQSYDPQSSSRVERVATQLTEKVAKAQKTTKKTARKVVKGLKERTSSYELDLRGQRIVPFFKTRKAKIMGAILFSTAGVGSICFGGWGASGIVRQADALLMTAKANTMQAYMTRAQLIHQGILSRDGSQILNPNGVPIGSLDPHDSSQPVPVPTTPIKEEVPSMATPRRALLDKMSQEIRAIKHWACKPVPASVVERAVASKNRDGVQLAKPQEDGEKKKKNLHLKEYLGSRKHGPSRV